MIAKTISFPTFRREVFDPAIHCGLYKRTAMKTTDASSPAAGASTKSPAETGSMPSTPATPSEAPLEDNRPPILIFPQPSEPSPSALLSQTSFDSSASTLALGRAPTRLDSVDTVAYARAGDIADLETLQVDSNGCWRDPNETPLLPTQVTPRTDSVIGHAASFTDASLEARVTKARLAALRNLASTRIGVGLNSCSQNGWTYVGPPCYSKNPYIGPCIEAILDNPHMLRTIMRRAAHIVAVFNQLPLQLLCAEVRIDTNNDVYWTCPSTPKPWNSPPLYWLL